VPIFTIRLTHPDHKNCLPMIPSRYFTSRAWRGSLAAKQRYRPQAQHAAPQAPRLPDAVRMLQRILVSVALQT